MLTSRYGNLRIPLVCPRYRQLAGILYIIISFKVYNNPKDSGQYFYFLIFIVAKFEPVTGCTDTIAGLIIPSLFPLLIECSFATSFSLHGESETTSDHNGKIVYYPVI